MRSLLRALFVSCVLAVASLPLWAEGVYVIQGPNGPVFTNKPQTGAKEVSLPPLSVVPAAPAPKVADKPPAAPAETPATPLPVGEEAVPIDGEAPVYQDFRIVQPENEGSVVANTAVFEVRLAVEPPLRLGDKHAFVVSINGRPVNQRYTATEFMIPPDFWEELPAPDQAMQLDASVIDGKGQVIKRAAPVRFYLRQAVRRGPPLLLPQPVLRKPASQPPLTRQKPVLEKSPEPVKDALPMGKIKQDH